jgi:capsular polysaccharide biosynthesis protein
MTDVLTVSDLGSTLLKRWRLLLVMALTGLAAGLGLGAVSPETYTTKAVLIVMAGPENEAGYYQAAQFAEKRAATYPTLITSPEVLDRTASELDLTMSAGALTRAVTATNPTDTPLVEVSATASTPKMARDIADTAADNLADYAVQLEETGSRITTVTIQKAVPAREPSAPSSPGSSLLGGLGLLTGGALGVVLALVLRTVRGRGPASAAAAAQPAAAPPAPESAEVEDEPAPAPARPHRPRSVPAQTLGRGPVAADDELDDLDEVDDPDDDEDDDRPQRKGPRGARRPVTTAGKPFVATAEELDPVSPVATPSATPAAPRDRLPKRLRAGRRVASRPDEAPSVRAG